MKKLRKRLALATLIPGILVTITLLLLSWSSMDIRLNSARTTAKALLEAEYDMFIQDLSESLNHALTLAEFPSVVQYLLNVEHPRLAERVSLLDQKQDRMESAFDSLSTYFDRYTRLVLIDTQGNERYPMQSSGVSEAGGHSDARYYQEAMSLEKRELFVSPPYLAAVTGPETERAVIDIAAPVFGVDDRRLGVMVLTLDWQYLANRLPHMHGAQSQVAALLVDAQGNSLLPASDGIHSFGSSIRSRWPDAWQEMQKAPSGEILLDEHILYFQSHDTCSPAMDSGAERLVGVPGTHPWYLGIIVPKPDLAHLSLDEPWKAGLVVFVYALAIALGIGWVLSNHHQRKLRASAQALSKEVSGYAKEFTDLYEHAPCGYHSLDKNGVILKINRIELQWLGYRADELVGKRQYRELVTPDTRDAFDEAFRRIREQDSEGSVECELIRRDGSTFPVAIEATAHKNGDGFQYSRTMVYDLTERKELENLLVRQAMTDPLTGLGNRRYLEDQAEREMAKSRRNGEALSLIVIDLDYFKRINDRYGHDIGDLVLRAFARTAQEQSRDGDVLCRTGGEEFTILLPETDSAQAVLVARRLRYAVQQNPVDIDSGLNEGRPLAYTASFGVTEIQPNEHSLKAAVKRADQALYEVKEAGRNRVHLLTV